MNDPNEIFFLAPNEHQRGVMEKYVRALGKEVNNSLPLSERIAQRFMITVQHFSLLQECLAKHPLASLEEEIYFFKKIKPFFTSRIELYTLQFKGMVFAPPDPVDAQDYWEQEAGRLAAFERQYPEFVAYIREGREDKDESWFTAAAAADVPVSWRTAYDVEDHFSSSHDPLLAALMALEQYHEFARKQLGGIISV